MTQTTAQLGLSPDDECPVCKKKAGELTAERQGMFFRAACGAFICECGTHYVPKSVLAELTKRAQSRIIVPTPVV